MDWRENAAVETGSVLGHGSLSVQQVGHTGSESATFVGGTPVPLVSESACIDRATPGFSRARALWFRP